MVYLRIRFLVLYFRNDLFYEDLESELCNFADDTTIHACETNFNSVIIKLERYLLGLLDSYADNSMCANPSKFKIIFLGLKRKTTLCLSINGPLILSSKHVKLPGVTIDNASKLDTHVVGMCKKVKQELQAFTKLRPHLVKEKSKLLLNAVALSNLYYCAMVWLFVAELRIMKLIELTSVY